MLKAYRPLVTLSKGVRYFCRMCSSPNEKRQVCIIGSGPAGMYAAKRLLDKSTQCEVDVFEKLPVPFGLIRYGVAPDHPSLKNLANTFTGVLAGERISFFGNVDVGRDVTVQELLEAYDAVILAYGASETKALGIPGEDSKHVLSAKQFVGWYNGHPEHVGEDVDLSSETVAIVGQGNIATDIARILLKDPKELEKTDISEHALRALRRSKVRKVILIGRRGPLQVAFTLKELREIGSLPGCNMLIRPEDVHKLIPLISLVIRPKRRLVEHLIANASKVPHGTDLKTCELRFCLSPKEFILNDEAKLERLVMTVNRLDENEEEFELVKAIPTEEEEVLDCGLVVKSIGYQCAPIDKYVPFDRQEHVVPNVGGRVIGQKGLYCSGWVRTGPQGVIAYTLMISYDVADFILKDIKDGLLERKPAYSRGRILELLKTRDVKFTTKESWLKIKEFEEGLGQKAGTPLQKIYNVKEMLQIAGVN